MNTAQTQPTQKHIEDLSLRELDMIYSLSRIGEWTKREIAQRYRISENNVNKVVDNYVELRKICESRPPEEKLQKPRKRRKDAQYASDAARQAAYRARLKESRLAGIGQPSLADDTDKAPSADEELCVTTCDDPVTEISPENADPQHSTGYSS